MNGVKLFGVIICLALSAGQAVADEDDDVANDIADNHYACGLTLCWKTPNEKACRGVFKKFHEENKKGKARPHCEGSSDDDDHNEVVAQENFDPCPPGTTAAAPGLIYTGRQIGGVTTFDAIGRSEMHTPNGSQFSVTDRACVKKPVGMYVDRSFDGSRARVIPVYDSVIWLTPRR